MLARDYAIGGAYWAAVIATIFSEASAEGILNGGCRGFVSY
jgi:hypothetical protein